MGKYAKHGLTNTPLHKIWMGMNKRCNCKTYEHYDRYGGRGIKVCKRWETFSNFYNDMIGTYKPGLTLERIDNELNYSPKNCRWATIKDQANNKSTNVYYTINGTAKTLAQWCEIYKVNYARVKFRLKHYDWGIVKSLTAKKYQRNK